MVVIPSLMKNTLLYNRKLYLTTENFTLLQKTLLHEKYFSTKFEPIKIPFSIQKLTISFYFDIN